MANFSNTPGMPQQKATVLRIIRIALLSGMLMFGAIVYLLISREGPRGIESAQALQVVNIAFLIGAAAALLFIQRRHAAEPDPAKRSTLNIIAWAVGETTAMFGGVHYLLVGSPAPYVVGVMMMLASFVLVPIRE